MKRTTYYPGGFNSALPSLGRAEEWDSAAGTYTAWSEAGAQTSQRSLAAQEVQEFAEAFTRKTSEDNADLLRAKASQALAANATYLAQPAIPDGTLTAAQLGAALRIMRAQVDLLTRESNAVIRLTLNLVDTTTGT